MRRLRGAQEYREGRVSLCDCCGDDVRQINRVGGGDRVCNDCLENLIEADDEEDPA